MNRPPPPHVWAWILGLLCGVAPIFASVSLPMVDLPQHLHLISVLHRLDDASTLFPEYFARRPVLTPYLGYYYVVSALSWVLPLELANKVFLGAYVAGMPLGLAFLLKSLKRPTWPALLAVPFAYGDSFGWGFINYCSALPLAFLTCGFFVRAIDDVPRQKQWTWGLALSLAGVLLFHVQVFAFLGVALPLLLVLTPTEAKAKNVADWVKARRFALLGVVPGVAMFLIWIGIRLGEPAEIAPGQPWKAWGPMFSDQNLAWLGFEANKAQLFDKLANLLPDQADQLGVKLSFVAAIGGALVALATGRANQERPLARARIVLLFALALLLYFALPFDIRGYMYYLNTRYVHLAAALLVCCVPAVKPELDKKLVWAGAAVAAMTAWPLVQGFRAFDAEAKALASLAQAAAPKPKVMGLIFNAGSRAVTLPVHLHASTVIARERGGLTNFSFATTPHSPLMYRGQTPPTFPSEWRPNELNWEQQGRYYDHFVVRGVHPQQFFGQLMSSELYVAAQAGDFFLVRKR